MDAEDPLYILYTSGSTGKPKAILHTHGGYMVGIATTLSWVFDLKEEDRWWCAADPGWITGHSYIVYGPLANGATVSNKGVELQLNVRPYTSRNVDVSLGANYARNRGRVESLIQGVQFISYNTEGFAGSGGSYFIGYALALANGPGAYWNVTTSVEPDIGTGERVMTPSSNLARLEPESALPVTMAPTCRSCACTSATFARSTNLRRCVSNRVARSVGTSR